MWQSAVATNRTTFELMAADCAEAAPIATGPLTAGVIEGWVFYNLATNA